MLFFFRAVFPRAESVQTELQAAVDRHATTEQPRGTFPSTQLSFLGKVQVTGYEALLLVTLFICSSPTQPSHVALLNRSQRFSAT